MPLNSEPYMHRFVRKKSSGNADPAASAANPKPAREKLSMPKTIRYALFLAAFAAATSVTSGAMAQTPPPQPVKWELQVIRDGQPIDSFGATTNVGQTKTDTHHNVVKNRVGCADQPAGDIDLSRILTISSTHANADDITLRSARNLAGRCIAHAAVRLQGAACAASGERVASGDSL